MALSPEDVERVAQRAAELVCEEVRALLGSRTVDIPTRLVNVSTMAAAFGVSERYIRSNAREFGGRQVGAGRLWRFDLAAALATKDESVARSPRVPEPRKSRSRTTQTTNSGVPLLPIRGEAVNGR
jgi:hypothetical protein